MADELERDRETIRGALRRLSQPADGDVVLTRWVAVSEYVDADGHRYCRIDTGDNDDYGLMEWDQMGLLGYGLELARRDAWSSEPLRVDDDDEDADEEG